MVMKTKLSVLLALVFFTQAAMDQFHLGVKGGVNITKVNGEAFRDEFRYGYHLGGFAELGLGGNLGIQPEVLWSQYQTRVDSSFSDVYQNSLKISNYKDVKLNYLTIPLLLNYKLGSLLSLQAGPQFGILLDQSKNLVQNGQSAFKNGDFSVVAVAQIHISKIRLQGRYFVGLNNISDISNQNKWNNQGFQLSLGLAL